ncbi:MAG: aryl-sulfate sulfotransferase, partial [Candidatus Helarchaeales archaeon]
SSSVNFSGFAVLDSGNYTPTIRLSVNSSPVGLLVGTEEFAYSVSGDDPGFFINPHSDDFSGSELGPYWMGINELNGDIDVLDGHLEIRSDADTHFGLDSTGQVRDDAPALVQAIGGDFKVKVKMNVSGITEGFQEAGIICRWGTSLNFFNMHYESTFLKIASSENGVLKILNITDYLGFSGVWLGIERAGNYFNFTYSSTGMDWEQLLYQMVPAGYLVQLGLYTSNGGSAIFDDWSISPSIACTGINGSTGTENITVTGIPFKNWNDGSMNKIQVRITAGNETSYSPIYNVSLSCEDPALDFTTFTVLNDSKENYVAKMDLSPALSSLVVPGSECFSLEDTVMDSPPGFDSFINPHRDDFSSTTLKSWWKIRNSDRLNISISNGRMRLGDTTNDSSLDGVNISAPFVYQKIKGEFEAEASFFDLIIRDGGSSGRAGISIMNLDDSRVIKFWIGIDTGDVIVFGIEQYNDTLGVLSFNQSIIDPGFNSSGPIVLRIEKRLSTLRVYYGIPGNDSGMAEFIDMRVDRDAIFKIGLFVESGAAVGVDDWFITPSVTFEKDIQTGVVSIKVRGISFPTTFLRSYSIVFGLNASNGTFSRSNILKLQIYDPDWDNKGLLMTYGVSTMILDRLGNILSSHSGLAQLDLEYLSNGNFLVVYGMYDSGSVVEYDPDWNVIWRVDEVDGTPLRFPHDADVLDNGNILITDSRNDRVVEVSPDGANVVWSWSVWDYFSQSDYVSQSSHVNDADRLPNGNTLITVRDLNTVVEVNPSGDIVWSYGAFGINGTLNQSHNAHRLSNGNTIICDSENHRIIEVNFSGGLVWEYFPVDADGAPELDWIRDAEPLPNGDLLVVDGHGRDNDKERSRIFELDRESGDVLWTLETPNPGYDVDLVDLLPPTVDILSPMNGTIHSSNYIPVVLKSNYRSVDMYYRVRDDTAGRYIDSGPVEYKTNTGLLLEDGHQYTLQALAVNKLGVFADPSVAHDYHPKNGTIIANRTFRIDLSSDLAAIDDLNYYLLLVDTSLEEITISGMDGSILEQMPFPADLTSGIEDIEVREIEMLPDKDIVLALDIWFVNGTNRTCIVRLAWSGGVKWQYFEDLGNNNSGFIDADYRAVSGSYLVSSSSATKIFMIDANKQVSKIWDGTSYFNEFGVNLSDAGGVRLGKVNWIDSDEIMFSIPADDSILIVNTTTEEVAWMVNNSLNNTGIFNPRAPTMAKNNESIFFINGSTNNLVAVDFSGNVTWNTLDFPWLASMKVERFKFLPNNHLLVLTGNGSEVLEINLDGTIISNISLSEPADVDVLECLVHLPPILVPNITEKSDVFHENQVSIQVFSKIPWLTGAASWRLFCITNNSWVGGDNFNQFTGGSGLILNKYLEDGVYRLELTLDQSMQFSINMGSDLYLFYDNIPDITWSYQFTVDVDAHYYLPAPYLIQGRPTIQEILS